MPLHPVTVCVSLLQHRAEAVVPERMAQMVRFIQQRDFEGFGQLTMQDSNQFHATCLDTFPPIFYLTDVSRRVIALAHRFNTHHGATKVRGLPLGHAAVHGAVLEAGIRVRVPSPFPPLTNVCSMPW